MIAAAGRDCQGSFCFLWSARRAERRKAAGEESPGFTGQDAG